MATSHAPGRSTRRPRSGRPPAKATPAKATPRRRDGGVPGAGAAAQKAVDENATGLDLPLIGRVRVPPVRHLAFYVGIVALAAVEMLDWPVALVVGVGKALADNRSSKTLQDLGEAMEGAG